MDLGECPKVHSEALRADFDEANKKKNYGFEKEVDISPCSEQDTLPKLG